MKSTDLKGIDLLKLLTSLSFLKLRDMNLELREKSFQLREIKKELREISLGMCK